MTEAKIDKRIIKVGIIIDDQINWYEGLNVEVKGVKEASSTSAQCDITILNVRREVREIILRETNPFENKGKRIQVVVEVGRESYGTTTFYTGDVFKASPTPKPNLGVRITCIHGYFDKSRVIQRSAKEISKLSTIAEWVATDNNCNVSFEIQDRNIARYSFTGSASSSILQLEDLCGSDVNVYIDNKTLFVKQKGTAAKGRQVRVLDSSSGLIKADGTEKGCIISMLFDAVTGIGSRIDLTSELNPSLNGSYTVDKLGFNLTNRGQAFYLTPECSKIV